MRLLVVTGLLALMGCGGGSSAPSNEPALPTPLCAAFTLDLSTLTPGGADFAIDRDSLIASLRLTDETFAPNDCAVVEGFVPAGGTRRLLRFATNVINAGEMDVALGDPANPLPPFSAADFDFSPCHGHYHLHDYATYELHDPTGRLVGFGHKQAFCLRDNQPVVAGRASHGWDCDFQGLSPGWMDVYDQDLDGQWVDVTGLPAGDYVLRVVVNPVGFVPEADGWPNDACVEVHLPDPATPLP